MKSIDGIEDLNNFIIDNINKVIVLYFGAIWCGPCKLLKERMNEEETKHMMPNMAMCYLDLDNKNNNKLFKKYKINCFPTQIFIKLDNNIVRELSRIEGYDFTKLKLDYDLYNS